MPANLHDNPAGWVLRILMVVVIQLLVEILCFKLWMVWAAAWAPTEGEDNAIIPPVPGVHPQGTHSDLIEEDPQGSGSWTGTRERKVTCKPCSVSVAGVQGETSLELFFELDCTRGDRHTRVKLKLEQMELGVKTWCTRRLSAINQSFMKDIFIKSLTIEARPLSWAQACHRLLLQPQTTSKVFQVQRNFTFGVQIPALCPTQSSIAFQVGRTLLRSAESFDWGPASRESNNSVIWPWEITRYVDGTKIVFGKIRWGSRPNLGIQPTYTQLSPGVSASWDIQNDDLNDLDPAWDLHVIINTAVLKKKKGLPGYVVSRGPTVSVNEALTFRSDT